MERDRAGVLTGLLDLFTVIYHLLPEVQLSHRQRMADFERLGEAVMRALGHAPGTFQARHAGMVRAGIDRALDGNPVAQALDKLMRRETLPWVGTAGSLYEHLGQFCGPDRSAWPRSPKGLTDQLRRVASAYRAKGIEIENRRHTRDGAVWKIDQHPNGSTHLEFPMSALADETCRYFDAAQRTPDGPHPFAPLLHVSRNQSKDLVAMIDRR